MRYNYNPENVFAKIIRGEIPSTAIAENDSALAFNDIAPSAPIHILVIPKGEYVNYDDFLAHATIQERQDFDALILEVIRVKNLTSEDGSGGYRVISNSGAWGMQEVPHYHVHILAGEPIGPLRTR